ncbi:hypothetical protein CAQU_00650 [Corynebacterium aquilae DSM 44791]|uniref:Major facilitator superfamily (MFS) profile domain-containing protein n=1 Tax=Corynebacterium aquilae DSM 44791 TaxID=1431546 RepID=A0A1L7CDA3_9CORY|nr:hypothetical protein CAQU_00650 [Corynebacterium aquilae DSM 44791]
MQRIGPRKTYLGAGTVCILSGLATTYAAYTHSPPLFYAGMLLVGIFMGLSNFHRLLVKDYSDTPNVWDTSLVLLSGIAGSILGPWAAGILAGSVSEFYKAYQLVIMAGILTLFTSFMLPEHSRARERVEREISDFDDRSTLYLGGVIGMLGYVVMTLIMTAIPLEAQQQGLSGREISHLTEVHMVAMYLPIVIVPLFLARYTPRRIATWALGLGGFGTFGVLVSNYHVGKTGLTILMIVAGVIWAFSYTAASNMVASSLFGKTHPSARGYVEMLPPIGMVIGSLLAGLLLEYAGFIWVVSAFIFISIIAVPTLILMGRAGHINNDN